MPLRELKCSNCMRTTTVLVGSSKTDAWRADVVAGTYVHEVEYEDGSEECGVFAEKLSLPAAFSALGDYPFMTAPWFLPPKVNEAGKSVVNQVEVHSRAQYKKLLRDNNLVEPETASDRQTMYKTPLGDGTAKIDREVKEDMKFYTAMKNNKEARRRIINDAVKRKETAGL
jgi:hypothetical protein